MRTAFDHALDLIKTFEGYQAKPYYCSSGYPTIGYGHRLTPGYDINLVLQQEEAEKLLMHDLYQADRAIERLIYVKMTPCQRAALLSFTFNVGPAALQRSSLRRKLNRGEYHQICDEFPKWIWSRGQKLPGLLRRRLAESALFKKGLRQA